MFWSRETVVPLCLTAVVCCVCLLVTAVVLTRGDDAPAAVSAPRTPLSVPSSGPSTYSLSGGAWLTKASGTSDLLRGLKVVVLPADVPRERLGVQSLRELVEERRELTAKLREDLVKELEGNAGDKHIGASLDRLHRELKVKDCDRQAESREKLLASLDDLEEPGPPLPTHRAWLLYRGAVLSLYDPGAEGGLDDAKDLAWMLWDVTATRHRGVG